MSSAASSRPSPAVTCAWRRAAGGGNADRRITVSDGQIISQYTELAKSGYRIGLVVQPSAKDLAPVRLFEDVVRDIPLERPDCPGWFARCFADIQVARLGRAFDRCLDRSRAPRHYPRQY